MRDNVCTLEVFNPLLHTGSHFMTSEQMIYPRVEYSHLKASLARVSCDVSDAFSRLLRRVRDDYDCPTRETASSKIAPQLR